MNGLTILEVKSSKKTPVVQPENTKLRVCFLCMGLLVLFRSWKNSSVFCSQRDTAKTQSVHLVSLPRPLSFPMAIPKLIGVKNAYSCGPLFPKTWEASQRMLLYHRISIQNYTCKEGARTPGLQVWSYQIKMLTEKLGVFEAKDQNPWVPSTILSQAVLENARFAAFSSRAYLWRSIVREVLKQSRPSKKTKQMRFFIFGPQKLISYPQHNWGFNCM